MGNAQRRNAACVYVEQGACVESVSVRAWLYWMVVVVVVRRSRHDEVAERDGGSDTDRARA